MAGLLSGCAALPDIMQQPQYHNPFPQLHRVAILPFYNQSGDPHVNQDEVALAYYNELQTIPGFEVMPVGTAKRFLEASRIEPHTAADFQRLAGLMGVDAIIVGSVTEYTQYYPPRLGLAVNWYAANSGFHPIPVGYGLPWGTAEEEYIPSSLVHAAEFALAQEQLKTQTPDVPEELQPTWPSPVIKPEPAEEVLPSPGSDSSSERLQGKQIAARRTARKKMSDEKPSDPIVPHTRSAEAVPSLTNTEPELVPIPLPENGGPQDKESLVKTPVLPPDWPDPRGFIPPAPAQEKPKFQQHIGPIITHTRLYDGHDSDFTEALANYFYFRDDARYGGWQAYLQRSDDFIRFCCHMHITETLAARGGTGESRVVWRWPIGRYER